MLRCTKAVSELLSQHVLQNYDKFVAGIDEVGKVKEDLIATYQTAKVILSFSQISATSPLYMSVSTSATCCGLQWRLTASNAPGHQCLKEGRHGTHCGSDVGRQMCSMCLQTARATLASGAVNISGALTVTRHSRHKQRLLDLLDPLLKLQEAKNLHIGLR